MTDDIQRDPTTGRVVLSANDQMQTAKALGYLVHQDAFTRSFLEHPVCDLMEYLYEADAAVAIVSTVVEYAGKHARETLNDTKHMMLCNRLPAIADAMTDAANDGPEIAARVQRSVQWINSVWAYDHDTVTALWDVVDAAEENARASDLCQVLHFIEYVYKGLHEGTARPMVTNIKEL